MPFLTKIFSAQTTSRYSLNTACFSVEITPMDKTNYHSTVDVAELGELSLGLVKNTSAVIERIHELPLDKNSKTFTISYAIDGELAISNEHSTTTLKKGQFMLIDNTLPRKMFVYDHVHLLLVYVTRSVLQRYIPVPEDVVAQVIDEPVNKNGKRLFTALLSIWEHLKKGELEDFYTTIGEELLHDIGMTYANHGTLHSRSRHRLRLIQQVRQCVELNLGNPEFSVEAIAAEFNISSRYLRSIFQGTEKISAYIQRRRVEESAKLLSSALFQSSSITEIAYLCGFNSSTHFARCFKSRFNETARNFRKRHLQMEHADGAK